MEKIDSEDISVIIQGPTLHGESAKSPLEICIDSIRRILPKAEIIVSTWKGQICPLNFADQIIFSEDPGTINNRLGQSWNFNRMVVSTRNGLKKSTRPYALKFRADLELSGTELFILAGKAQRLDDDNSSIFRQRVVTTNIFARNPASHAPLLFHPSDIVQFGLTEDLRDFWGRRNFQKEDVCLDFSFNNIFGFLGYTGLRMVPEQALMTDWLRAHGHEVDLPYPGYISKKYCEMSETLISSNFFFVDWRASGVIFPQRFLVDRKLDQTIYDADYANSLSKIYADPNSRNDRVKKVIWNARVRRVLGINFWIDCLSIPLIVISPKFFFKVRNAWRRLTRDEQNREVYVK